MNTVFNWVIPTAIYRTENKEQKNNELFFYDNRNIASISNTKLNNASSIIKIENIETLQFQLLEGYKVTTNNDCYVEVLVKNFNIKFRVRVDNFIKYTMPYISMDADRNILNDDMALIFEVRDVNSVTNNISLISKQSPLYTEISKFTNKYYQHTNENVNTFVPGYTYKFKKSEGTYMYMGERDVCGYTFGNKANVQQLPTNEDEVSVILPLCGFNKNWINGAIFKRIGVKAHVFMKSNEDGTYSVKTYNTLNNVEMFYVEESNVENTQNKVLEYNKVYRNSIYSLMTDVNKVTVNKVLSFGLAVKCFYPEMTVEYSNGVIQKMRQCNGIFSIRDMFKGFSKTGNMDFTI